MADNLTTQSTTPATVPAASQIATDDVSGVHFQKVKLVDGTADSATAIPGDATNGLDVDVTRVQGTVTVTGPLTDTQLRATPVPVSGTVTITDGSGVVTVDGTVAVSNFPATQPVSGTLAVSSVAGTVTVDGSGVTQPVSAASLPLPSGAATAAKQPALGTAGTPSADVITVQGVTSMTALKVDGSAVTQPVSLVVGPAATADILTASPAGTTTAGVDTTIFSAVAAKYIYVTSITVTNTSNTSTLISFYRNAYATEVVFRTIAPALGGSNITFPVPLRLSTVNQLFGYRHETTVSGGTVYVSAVGYAGA